jgi:deoxyribonuclease V
LSDPVPFAIVDVHYFDSRARAACVVAQSWNDAAPSEEHVVLVEDVAPYVPGRFFERELPCILAVLPALTSDVRAIVIDGYVQLDAAGTPGLGAHLFERLSGRCPVIGAAKTAYGESAFARAVLRGSSARPLYVTAAGIDPDDAARLVKSLHGPHRIPSLIEHVDHLARDIPP